MAVVTKTELENASVDAKTLEYFINNARTDADPTGGGSAGTVTARLGNNYDNLAKIIYDIGVSADGAVSQAQAWATTAEDVEVSGGLYSALHWAAKAEDAKVAAVAAAESVVDRKFDTKAALEAATVASATKSVETAGYTSAGDSGGALYKRVDAEPSHAGKIRSEDRYLPDGTEDETNGGWWENVAAIIDPKMTGAKNDGTTSTAQIKAALAIGRPVFFSDGIYDIDELIFPAYDGQIIDGAGPERVTIRNSTNDEPLFCFGDPTVSDGATQFCRLQNVHLQGRTGGATLWGLWAPNASFVDGTANASGQHEGVSSSANNFYYGRTSFTMADWTIAARGCSIENVYISNVHGDYAMHVSAWGFQSEGNIRLWSGKRGLRSSGAANGNTYEGLYISSMANEGIVEPDRPYSIPTSCTYINPIVQQCGADDGGLGAIALYKSQSTKFIGLYIERNNEKASSADVAVGIGAAAIGTSISGIRHRNDNAGEAIIVNKGQGTRIGEITVSGSDVAALDTVVRHDGNDSRTSTFVDGPINGIDGTLNTTDDVISSVGTASYNLFTKTPDRTEGYSFSALGDKLYKAGSKVALRTDGSTSRVLALESSGTMRFVTDVNNATGGGDFYWYHNGEDATGTLLLTLDTNGGHLQPGTDNTQILGGPSNRWSQLYAGSGTINTSDARAKEWRGGLSKKEQTVAQQLAKIIGIYQFKEAVEDKGSGARLHIGVTAQDVQELFKSNGLDGFKYGLLCWDQWTDKFEWDYDEEGNPIGDPIQIVKAGERYGIRYDQLALWLSVGFDLRLAKIENQLDR